MSEAKAVGGKILTPGVKVVGVLAAIGLGLAGFRLATNLGTVTNLNDGYPWGLWIAFDVVTGTALACGGYAVALLAYVFNKGRYHPLVRPAVLTSLLGYAMGAFGVFIDLGRYWKILRVLWPEGWNFNSILLEVALCIAAYNLVLVLELAPAFLEKGKETRSPGLQKLSEKLLPILDKAMIFILALGLLLPTMHQSSLGGLMMIAGPKLHPLWHTGFLPLLFLLTCVGMGYAAVIFEGVFSAWAFNRPMHMDILGRLAPIMAWIIFAYDGLRLVDLGIKGRLGLMFSSGWLGMWFILEQLVFIGVAVALLMPKVRRSPGLLLRVAIVGMIAGTLYRLNTFIIAFDPGAGWTYFPSVIEVLVTLGLVSFEIFAYVVIVKKFPILAAAPRAAERAA